MDIEQIALRCHAKTDIIIYYYIKKKYNKSLCIFNYFFISDSQNIDKL